jgi:hypothetical protein
LIVLPYVVGSKEQAQQIIDHRTSPETMLPDFQAIYAKYFTASEMLDLIGFARSRSGQKFFANEEAVRQEMVEAAVQASINIAVDVVREICGPDKNPPDLP